MTGTATKASNAGKASPAKTDAVKTKKKKKVVPSAEVEANDPTLQLLSRRLFSARKSKRLDVSIARTGQSSSELVPFQVFPRQIFVHEHMSGHHLRELWLTNHHISVLPSEIGHFPELRVLGLAGNALARLPPEIALLSSLESLYLERNELRAFPETVVFPVSLRDLRLDHNGMTTFPLQIMRLRLLNRLGLSHNRLREVPSELRRLTNLVELDLDDNVIDSAGLPHEAFARLRRLERLGLDGNHLSNRPAFLDTLPTLSYVRLNGNKEPEATPVDTGAPRRHDGYFQTVAGYAPQKPTPEEHHTRRLEADRPLLEGVAPCSEQNLINALSYRCWAC